MRLDDRITGGLLASGGTAYTATALGLPGVPGQDYGAGFFPTIIGSVMTLAGAAILVRAVVRPHPPSGTAGLAWSGGYREMARFAGVLAAVAFYIFLSPTLGFALTALLIMVALALALGARPVTACLVAIGAVIVFEAVFGRLLRVPLPAGFLDLLL